MQNKSSKSHFGIDLNEYTTEANFIKLASTIDFLYLRASGSGSGRFKVDKKFVKFAGESRKYGIPVGAYHFGVPSYDLLTADEQCDYFIGTLEEGFGDKNYGDLYPVLDVEVPVDNKITTRALVDWIDRFRKRFEKKTRRRLMLYTGVFFVELYNDFKLKSGEQPLKNMPLWVAMYTNIPVNPPFPPNVGGWERWRMWQYSESEIVSGVGNPCDANWGPDNLDLLMQPKKVRHLKAVKENNIIKMSWSRNKDTDLLGYNLFANGHWIGTVGKEDTSFEISRYDLPKAVKEPISISIEAFDYDGEASQNRANITL